MMYAIYHEDTPEVYILKILLQVQLEKGKLMSLEWKYSKRPVDPWEPLTLVDP